jgi:transposase
MIFPGGFKVYIAVGYVDMRKAIDGLSAMVSGVLRQDPFAGHLFAFSNRKRNMIKILYWQQNGFCLWQKRLEKGRFHWPDSAEAAMQVSPRELSWLIDGLEINQAKAHRHLNYSKSY